MNYNLLVSVIVVSYNHADYIEKCLSSILNQSYGEIELIVVDNNSKDGSVSLIEDKLSGVEKAKLIKLEKNIGIVGAINIGLNIAKGEFITFFASDDIMLFDRIERQVDFLYNHKDAAGCFGNMVRINSDDSIHKLGLLPVVGYKKYKIEDILYSRIDLYSPTQMFKTDILKEVIGHIPNDVKIEDVWMYHKILSSGYSLYTVPYLFTEYRIHGNNTHTKYNMMFDEKIKILNEYKNKPYYKKALIFIYLEHFSVFCSVDKMKALSIFPKISYCITSKYYWIGLARLILDWRFFCVR